MQRRDFLKTLTAAAGAGLCCSPVWAAEKPTLFDISLAEWSLHRELMAGKMDHLDFATRAQKEFGIGAVEYVNRFFKDKALDRDYLGQMNQRAADAGVRNVLIMIDDEGNLGDPDESKRAKAVENHHKWVSAAKTLGCHSIRVNARSNGSDSEQRKLAADGLRRLASFAADSKINVIVENHGGLSSNGAWLASVIRDVDLPNCGTLPDFGNFRLSKTEMYDRYQGVSELMPLAKAVSAKSHDFDDQGNETQTDYFKMMKIVVDAGYHGYVGIEYEGAKLSEPDGIIATKKLLERVREKLS
jgi:sugar phosphate isomerase/epimerase